MSKTVENAMYYSWMSQASYLNLSGITPLNDNVLDKALQQENNFADDKLFTAEQAESFVNDYNFVHQQPNTYGGMSATIFQDKSDSGSYTFAVRGTEVNNVGDILSDVFGVVAEGQAKVQVIHAFHYYKQLTTEPGEDIQYTEQEKEALLKLIKKDGTIIPTITPEDFAAMADYLQKVYGNDVGIGGMENASTINFTGHSLGGHVAYLLAGLVEQTQSLTIGDVMTYNAPGEDSLFYEVLNWVTPGTIWSAEGPIGSKHLAFYGEEGIEVTALSGKVIGTPVYLFGMGWKPVNG